MFYFVRLDNKSLDILLFHQAFSHILVRRFHVIAYYLNFDLSDFCDSLDFRVRIAGLNQENQENHMNQGSDKKMYA